MIKDTLLRLLFIPMLGIIISYVSGIISYYRYNIPGVIAGCMFFIFTSFFIWRGCQWIHLKVRQLYTVKQNPFPKILSVCIFSAIYGSAIAIIFCMLWLKISREQFRWAPVSKFIGLTVLAVVLFTLIYEIVYLSKERELDNKIVHQLDDELTRAEITALRNELDPHFIFNSLNTLSHLINHDSVKADLFNNKLAQVYKYFLINKDKELIPVEKEIEFIKNYFFLLKIRHEERMQLHITVRNECVKDILIVPCALQILIENAIKHNDFTALEPLEIYIRVDDEYLSIENKMNHKQVTPESTKIGLRNLGAQYMLTSNKTIVVEENENRFIVKLPVIKLPQNEYA